jgi:hypothetical protein
LGKLKFLRKTAFFLCSIVSVDRFAKSSIESYFLKPAQSEHESFCTEWL